MKADNGSFTVQQAWDEYYGPIALAKQQDNKWPFTPARKKAFRRRRLFMEMIANKAKYEGRDVVEVVDSLTKTNMGKTINTIRESLALELKARGVNAVEQ